MSTSDSEKSATLIIIDQGEVETFGEEPEIIDWTWVLGPYGRDEYDTEDLIAMRDTIAQYEGTEEYVATLNELIEERVHG